MVRKTYVIINPVSGKGDKHIIKRLTREAEKYHDVADIIYTTRKENASVFSKRAVESGAARIIVCGGDGTVREAVGSLVHKKIILGIVPLGTGNIFAKNLGIPLEYNDALKIAFSETKKKIDAGLANKTHFVLVAGMGLDVDMMRHTGRESKEALGTLAYVVSGLRNVQKSPRRYKLIIDTKKALTVQAKSILVANIGKTEASLPIVPGAHPTSGNLRIGIIKADSVLAWTELLGNLLLGKPQESEGYDVYAGEKVVIRPQNGPQMYECDGDVFPPVEKLSVRILPGALYVAVPDSS